MNLNQMLWAEVKSEAENTRKLLSLVPFDHSDFKPHERSMSLKRLAIHVAEITGWWKECLTQDELDFAKGDFTPKKITTTEELLAFYDDLLAKTEIILRDTPESEFQKPWTMRNGEQIYFTMPKFDVVRSWCMNHLYHHRAQLGVYLRILNVPIPGMYGPSADDAQLY
ncbi:MAG: DinB family protein [Ignavibacteria bacterium]|nr:DinB family protein [Ignavibacteria bacterium]